MLRGENISFSYSKDKDFIKNLNINIPKGKITSKGRSVDLSVKTVVVNQHYLVFYLLIINLQKEMYL